MKRNSLGLSVLSALMAGGYGPRSTRSKGYRIIKRFNSRRQQPYNANQYSSVNSANHPSILAPRRPRNERDFNGRAFTGTAWVGA